MTNIDEPPDPTTARKTLIAYLNKKAIGEPVNGELVHYGSYVVADFRRRVPCLQDHGNYAKALIELATRCYRGVSGRRELEEMLEAFEEELAMEMHPTRAAQLKMGLEFAHRALV